MNGRVTGRYDSVTGINESFNYDVLDRLTQSVTTNANAPGQAAITKTMSYDAVGNILTKSDVGTYSYGGSHAHAVTSIGPASGPAMGYSYDADGSVISGGGRTLSYDATEMVQTVTEGANTVSYTYYPGNQRATQTTPTETTHYYNFENGADASLHGGASLFPGAARHHPVP